MPTQHWKGPTIPATGDDLLKAWPTAIQTAGIVTQAASIAAARTMLTAADNAGTPPTPANPAYFDILNNLYKSTGSRGGNGVWDLKMVSQPEFHEDTFTGSIDSTRDAGSQSAVITSSLPAQPYDRMVLAWGMLNGNVDSGSGGVQVMILNGDSQVGWWATNASTDSQASFNMRMVPAGTDPQVILAIKFGYAASTAHIRVIQNVASNKLMVAAFPITMN